MTDNELLWFQLIMGTISTLPLIYIIFYFVRMLLADNDVSEQDLHRASGKGRLCVQYYHFHANQWFGQLRFNEWLKIIVSHKYTTLYWKAITSMLLVE